jgi:hypothetical protein
MAGGIQLHELALTALNELNRSIDAFPESGCLWQRPQAMP